MCWEPPETVRHCSEQKSPDSPIRRVPLAQPKLLYEGTSGDGMRESVKMLATSFSHSHTASETPQIIAMPELDQLAGKEV